MEVNVRFHRADSGLVQAISTNATDEGDFLAAVADELQSDITREIHHALHSAVNREPDKYGHYSGRSVDLTMATCGMLIHRVLRHSVEVCCRLRGYKADVTEHRVIIAGEILPTDMVGLIPTLEVPNVSSEYADAAD